VRLPVFAASSAAAAKSSGGHAGILTGITLDEAPRGYAGFDDGVAKKFLIDPHGVLKNAG